MNCIEPKYKIGDLVVIKSYPNLTPLEGNPDLLPPIMIVIGIEIESNKKKTCNSELGLQIAERTKYEVLWFESKKSTFVTKIIYESFLKIKDQQFDSIKYQYNKVTRFKPTALELKKKKIVKSTVINEEGKEILQKTVYSLLTFTCPDLIITGINKNKLESSFDDFGCPNKIKPEKLVKVMWYNNFQQKYSEFELPLEVLIEPTLEEQKPAPNVKK